MNAIDSQDLHSEADEERFTVYLRFPFPRDGFEDPISVCVGHLALTFL